MEDYTPRDVIKALKAILPKYKTRKRPFIDKRNYLICVLYYKFNYTEEMISNIFRLSKHSIDRSTVSHAKRQPTRMANVRDTEFLENISILYKKFPFKIPETNSVKFFNKDVTVTLTNEELCKIKDFASDQGLKKGQAVRKLIEIALNTIDTNLTEMLWEE